MRNQRFALLKIRAGAARWTSRISAGWGGLVYERERERERERAKSVPSGAIQDKIRAKKLKYVCKKALSDIHGGIILAG
jgi:hypothetical protein